jgi:hypothetical protein
MFEEWMNLDLKNGSSKATAVSENNKELGEYFKNAINSISTYSSIFNDDTIVEERPISFNPDILLKEKVRTVILSC